LKFPGTGDVNKKKKKRKGKKPLQDLMEVPKWVFKGGRERGGSAVERAGYGGDAFLGE
jgi:hypothetical protein